MVLSSRVSPSSPGQTFLTLLIARDLGAVQGTELVLEQVAVAFDFPLTDGKVVSLPFDRLIFDEFIA